MRFTALILATSLLVTAPIVSAESLAKHRIHLETNYQIALTACQSTTKTEIKICLKNAKDNKKQAYADAWRTRSANEQIRTYTNNPDTSKPQINQDYKDDLSFCKELDKVALATCQREALARKKGSLTSVTMPPK